MHRPVEFDPKAIEEAAAAYDWYVERSLNAAERFQDEVDYAVDAITQAPDTWPCYLHGTQRFLLRRFPYQLVYRVERDRILVVAVAHLKRRPGYWRKR